MFALRRGGVTHFIFGFLLFLSRKLAFTVGHKETEHNEQNGAQDGNGNPQSSLFKLATVIALCRRAGDVCDLGGQVDGILSIETAITMITRL